MPASDDPRSSAKVVSRTVGANRTVASHIAAALNEKTRAAARRRLVAGMAALLVLSGYPGVDVAGDGAAVIRDGFQPIPATQPVTNKAYKSWSIFLICNPEWMVPESQQRIVALYEQFKAFGVAIGPDNVAIWFAKGSDAKHPEKVDFDRSAQFCSQLKLSPSHSPYVILSTQFPGVSLPADFPKNFPATLGNHVLLSLNGATAADAARLLGALADQIVTSDLSHLKVDSNEYWGSMKQSYVAVRDNLVGFMHNITISFDAGPVKTELKF